MTILHARSEQQFTEHLRRVLAEANGVPHSVDIVVGNFYLSGFNQVAARQGAYPHRPHRRPHSRRNRRRIQPLRVRRQLSLRPEPPIGSQSPQ